MVHSPEPLIYLQAFLSPPPLCRVFLFGIYTCSRLSRLAEALPSIHPSNHPLIHPSIHPSINPSIHSSTECLWREHPPCAWHSTRCWDIVLDALMGAKKNTTLSFPFSLALLFTTLCWYLSLSQHNQRSSHGCVSNPKGLLNWTENKSSLRWSHSHHRELHACQL